MESRKVSGRSKNRVDLRKMTFGQRLEGSEGASHVNI